MEISRTSAAAVAALCLAVGAGGAYIATGGRSDTARPDDPPAASLPVTSQEPEPASPGSPAASPDPGDVRTAAPAAAPTRPRPQGRTAAGVTNRAVGPAVAPVPSETPAAATAQTIEPAPSTASAASEGERQDAAGPAITAPEPEFEELIVDTDTVIGLQVDAALSSDRARVEDTVTAHVTRDVRVGDRVAIPTGARAVGTVTLVERGGRMRGRARLGLRFTAVELADGTRIAIDTDTVYRDGDPPGRDAAARVGGGAVVGAIIGGMLGGAKGAVLGGSAGAGAGTAAVLAGGRNAATLPAGTAVTVRLLSPATVTVEP